MFRDGLLFLGASSASARNVLVEYVATPLTVVFRETKVISKEDPDKKEHSSVGSVDPGAGDFAHHLRVWLSNMGDSFDVL